MKSKWNQLMMEYDFIFYYNSVLLIGNNVQLDYIDIAASNVIVIT